MTGRLGDVRVSARAEEVRTLLRTFAARTGLDPRGPQRRYLWTDAFAVQVMLDLAGEEPAFGALAAQLIEDVHDVLGRFRRSDPRRGWLSGLDELAGAARPTAGGLRIGKRLPERRPDEPFDRRLEWDRDGQYFHYLTRWIDALDDASARLSDPRYFAWARELLERACAAFFVDGRLVWKMSVDLSRPLVSSTGQHDALDGLIACARLQARGAALGRERALLEHACRPEDWPTQDPLGLGILLVDAAHAEQVGLPASLVERLRALGSTGAAAYETNGELEAPASERLAFRELGLAIGAHTLDSLEPLAARIVAFWSDPGHRATESWTEHADINDVMLAAALCPHGVLALPRPHGKSR